MIPTAICADAARGYAHTCGVCRAMVSEAVNGFAKTGKLALAYRLIGVSRDAGRPPEMLLVLLFSMGPDEREDTGWNGMACGPITDQKEFNQAVALANELLRELYGIS